MEILSVLNMWLSKCLLILIPLSPTAAKIEGSREELPWFPQPNVLFTWDIIFFSHSFSLCEFFIVTEIIAEIKLCGKHKFMKHILFSKIIISLLYSTAKHHF